MEKTTIMGFGNPIRQDDAVGIYVIQRLKEQLQESEYLQILDMGTSAFEVIFKLKGQDRIILVDAVVNTGEEVGTLYKVPAEELESNIEEDPMLFLHHLKWDQALSYAKKILQDDYPNKIDVYLIAINNTKFNLGMSAEARAGAERLAEKLLRELYTYKKQGA